MKNIVSIAVSGPNGTGKTTLCTLLSHKLQWEHVKVGQEFRNIALEFGFNIEKFGSVPDDILLQIDRIMKERMDNEANIIWDGRLSCFLARGRSDIFKILCVADLDVRVTRTSKRDNIPPDKAREQITAREEEEKRVFRRLYNLEDPFDKRWIDLIIDTSKNTPYELVDTILTSVSLD